MHSLGKILLSFALLCSILQGQICLLLQVSLGEGNGTPLQYSCLENPIDGGAWWAAVHGVAKSRTRLSDFTFTFHFPALEKEMATTPVFLPGESQGQQSLVGCRLWGPWSWTRLKQLSSSSSQVSLDFLLLHSSPL